MRVTDSGLIVPDARHHSRALPPPGSADHGAEITPNLNDPVGTVGPQAMAGPVLQAADVAPPGPPMMMPWDGWPAGWDTPNWIGQGAGGLTSSDIVYACIDLNARVTADMPVSVRTGGLPAEPRPWLTNPQPEIYASWADFWQQLWWDFQGSGEAIVYATSRFADGFPRTFMALEPSLVNIELDDRTGLRTFYAPSGVDITEDVCHIRYLTNQQWARGIGPLEAAGENVRASRALSRYGSDLAQGGGIPWAVLSHKFRLTPTQVTNLRTQWLEAAKSRMGAPAIIDQDMQLTQMQVTPKDMALRELQEHSESRIAVLLGVPPFLVGLPAGGDSLTYSSSVSLFDYHWRSMLRPKAREITAAFSGWALPRGTELHIDPSSYVQESMAVTGQFLEAMQRMGAMTVEEIRQWVGMPPAPVVGTLPEPRTTAGSQMAVPEGEHGQV